MEEMDVAIDIHAPSRKPKPEFKRQTVQEFWRKKQEEIEAIEDFRKHPIPMRRLKKVVNAKKGKIMMRTDSPSFLAKACELFVQELTFRAWMCANSHGRRIILGSDIAEAVASIKTYGFLNNVLRSELNRIKPEVPQAENDTNADSMNDGQHHHGSLVAEVVPDTNASEDNQNINWDEVDTADDSLLMKFWEDIMMNEDPALSLATNSTIDHVPFPRDMPELDGFGNGPYLFDDIVSGASTSKRPTI
ncbi:unnamed protein product [Urochloa decumbens]|uniref:Core Histone H2A/H2B/H3 domain-containing protein n=1 Tax=Urochloa decumbens TaxID=240449 RepID=A0ABC9GMB5_9POAL